MDWNCRENVHEVTMQPASSYHKLFPVPAPAKLTRSMLTKRHYSRGGGGAGLRLFSRI